MTETLRTRARRLTRDLRRSGRTPRPIGSPPPWAYAPPVEDFPVDPDDLDGGAGVREPRRPAPPAPTGALAMEEPTEQHLDLTR